MKNYSKCWLFIFVSLYVFVCCKNEDVEYYEDPQKVEEVCACAKIVKEKVDSFFVAINSVSEITEFLDEIKTVEGVENAYIDNSFLRVKIKDGGSIVWGETFIDNDSLDEDYYNSILTTMQKLNDNFQTSRNINNVGKDKKVCIINAVSEDLICGGVLAKSLMNETKKMFENFGFSKVDIIDANRVTDAFYFETMPTYNVILLHTHGMYKGRKHYITTGETPDLGDFISIAYKNWLDGKYDYLCVSVKDKRKGDEKLTLIDYVAISEEFIAEKSKNYLDNSIMFASVCHTLNENDSFWEVLKKKNLGTFLGFDESIHYLVSLTAGDSYFSNLLYYQNNVKEAYDIMPISHKEWINQDKGVKATLKFRSQDNEFSFYEGVDFSEQMMVDLGLSVKWASCNWGAASMTEFGETFRNWHLASLGNRWGIHKKDPEFKYKDGCYHWHDEDGGCTQCLLTEGITNTKYDYIYKQNKKMRMPKVEDFEELLNNCDLKSVIIDDVPGIQFISKINGKSIFLPAHTNDYTEIPGFGKETIKVYVTEGSYLTATFDKSYTNNDEFIGFVAENSLLSFNFMGQASNMSVINDITVKLFSTNSYIFEKDESGNPLFDVNDIPIYYYYIRPVCD